MSAGVRSGIEHERRLEAAADWLLRLRDPGVPETEIAEWLAWCDAAPENKRAFERLQSLWRETGGLRERPVGSVELESDRYSGRVSVQEWRFGSPAAVDSGRRRRLAITAAAAIAATIAAIAFFLPRSGFDPAARDVTIAATAGINREVVLPDGTSVTVAGGSSLATRYNAGERHVFLERGEAFFRVKRDPRRPFVVHAFDATVTAVGTAFNVRAEAGMVRVAVTEGVVDVDRAESTPPDSSAARKLAGAGNIRLQAGHQVTFADGGPAPIVVSVDAARAAAWVTGTLQFVDEPLSSVLAAVNRYSAEPIALADGRLGELRFTGTVVASRVDEWLRGLPNVFPVEVRPDRGAGVLIAPAAAGQR